MIEDRPNKRRIVDVINVDTGDIETSYDLLFQNEKIVWKLRRSVEERIQENDCLYLCLYCKQPVAISPLFNHNSNNHSFYFRHLKDSEECEIKTNSGFSKKEILALKFNGAKESKAHLELKNYIRFYLSSDLNFKDVTDRERIVRDVENPSKWKRPDVAATYKNKPIIFEIQLSTTFLDVIVAREKFYLKNDITIMWIFKDFKPDSARAAEKDIYFDNHTNVFSVDEKSRKKTLESGKLHFTCHYIKTFFDSKLGDYSDIWTEELITFDDLQIDDQTKKPFFKKYDRSNLRDKEVVKAQNKFENFIRNFADKSDSRDMNKILAKLGLLKDNWLEYKIITLSRALLSVKVGKVLFSNQENKWTWLVNTIWVNNIDHWLVFLYAVKEYGRTELVFGNNPKIKAKRKEFELGFKTDERFKQCTDHYPLISEMFPELKKHLSKYLASQ